MPPKKRDRRAKPNAEFEAAAGLLAGASPRVRPEQREASQGVIINAGPDPMGGERLHWNGDNSAIEAAQAWRAQMKSSKRVRCAAKPECHRGQWMDAPPGVFDVTAADLDGVPSVMCPRVDLSAQLGPIPGLAAIDPSGQLVAPAGGGYQLVFNMQDEQAAVPPPALRGMYVDLYGPPPSVLSNVNSEVVKREGQRQEARQEVGPRSNPGATLPFYTAIGCH